MKIKMNWLEFYMQFIFTKKQPCKRGKPPSLQFYSMVMDSLTCLSIISNYSNDRKGFGGKEIHYALATRLQ